MSGAASTVRVVPPSDLVRPTIRDLYRRHLHAATCAHSARDEATQALWWGVSYGFRVSAALLTSAARDLDRVAVGRAAYRG